MKYSRTKIRFKITPILALLFAASVLSFSASAQTKTPEQKTCAEFTNMPAGATKATAPEEVKLGVRKFIWTSWQNDKNICADLTLVTPNGNSFKWTYSISFDRSHKKQLTVQFFDKGAPQSTVTVFAVKRLSDNPDYALELLDENGKRMGIL